MAYFPHFNPQVVFFKRINKMEEKEIISILTIYNNFNASICSKMQNRPEFIFASVP